MPYKKHKKSRSLEAFFLTNDPFVIPCYSSFTPQVKPQHFQNLCPAYHFILWWIFCFMWSAITSFFISHFSGPPKHLNSSMSFAKASLMFCLVIRQLLASLSKWFSWMMARLDPCPSCRWTLKVTCPARKPINFFPTEQDFFQGLTTVHKQCFHNAWRLKYFTELGK